MSVCWLFVEKIVWKWVYADLISCKKKPIVVRRRVYIRSDVDPLQTNRAEQTWLELHAANFKDISTKAQIV